MLNAFTPFAILTLFWRLPIAPIAIGSMRIVVLFAATLIFLCGCSMPSGSDSNANHVNKIEEVRKMSNAAIERHDAAALARTWTDDYHVVTSRNFEVAGKKMNIDRLGGEFAAKPDVIYIRTSEKIEVFSKWKMASESGTWVGRWTENGVHIELEGTYFAKWHNINGEWLVRAEIFVPLSCTGGAACEKSPF